RTHVHRVGAVLAVERAAEVRVVVHEQRVGAGAALQRPRGVGAAGDAELVSAAAALERGEAGERQAAAAGALIGVGGARRAARVQGPQVGGARHAVVLAGEGSGGTALEDVNGVEAARDAGDRRAGVSVGGGGGQGDVGGGVSAEVERVAAGAAADRAADS